MPLITLTTDFGTRSPYVAAMKGVISNIASDATILDLSHEIPPQDVMQAAYFVRDAIPWFPEESIHVIVVDPGVGTSRLPLLINCNGLKLLCPDNGVWTLLESTEPSEVYVLKNPAYWLEPVSNTFHGRDIFAPCAAALANGITAADLGQKVDTWQRLHLPTCIPTRDGILGEVVSIDHFGNLITNIPRDAVLDRETRISIKDKTLSRLHRTYGDAPAGELIALISSSQFLELAVVHGHATSYLQAILGTPVHVQFLS